jgi:hypothetical protein
VRRGQLTITGRTAVKLGCIWQTAPSATAWRVGELATIGVQRIALGEQGGQEGGLARLREGGEQCELAGPDEAVPEPGSRGRTLGEVAEGDFIEWASVPSSKLPCDMVRHQTR